MGSSTGQEGHRLHNQWKRVTSKTEKRKQTNANQHAGKLSDWRQSGWLVPCRFLLNLQLVSPPSGVMKESIISTPSWGKQRERGREAGGQAVSTSVRTEILGWCTAAVMNSAAHWSQAPSLSLSTSHCTEAYAHTHLHCLQPSSTT